MIREASVRPRDTSRSREIRNPKHEIRNNLEIRMPEMIRRSGRRAFDATRKSPCRDISFDGAISVFQISNFGFVSDFDIRISNFRQAGTHAG